MADTSELWTRSTSYDGISVRWVCRHVLVYTDIHKKYQPKPPIVLYYPVKPSHLNDHWICFSIIHTSATTINSYKMCWWIFVPLTIVTCELKIWRWLEKKALPDLYLQKKTSYCQFENDYLNLSNHILILCITTEVDWKNTHPNQPKKLYLIQKERCSLLCCV